MLSHQSLLFVTFHVILEALSADRTEFPKPTVELQPFYLLEFISQLDWLFDVNGAEFVIVLLCTIVGYRR